ncbi:MAG TPA: DUF3623 domain-containing protein [Rhodospirillaceae bacterium]|nr:DUF3623 domain-containing protein [Rhodospirillaceae bacterium]
MMGHGLTLVFAVFLWWFSTGIILNLCGRPKRTFGKTLLGGSVVLVVALYGLADSAWSVSEGGAYLAFLSAIAVWGWLEMSFLMGYVTGPRTSPCPSDAKGWHRFTLALRTLLYHELAIIAGAGVIIVLTWGAPNQTATVAFLILMVMRISAKLNIFLGVPYLPVVFLPERLSYLKSYFRTRRFNWLLPVSIIGSALFAVSLGRRALVAEGAEAVGCALLFSLLALAMLEHFFMILPFPDAALWRWAKPVGAADDEI